MRLGRDIGFLFLGAVLAIVAQGLATELQLEIGQSRFSPGLEDTFYQSDMHTDNYLRPVAVSIGLADKWKGSERFGWRIALIAMGNIKARDNNSVNDEWAHRHAGALCTHASEDGCTLRFNGEGSTFGILTSLTAEQPLTSGLSLIGEAGLFFFQHHFKAEARFIDCTCSRQVSYNETSRLWDQPSPMVGVTLRYSNPFGLHGIAAYVAARHYWPAEHRALSMTNFAHTDYMVGIAKDLR